MCTLGNFFYHASIGNETVKPAFYFYRVRVLYSIAISSFMLFKRRREFFSRVFGATYSSNKVVVGYRITLDGVLVSEFTKYSDLYNTSAIHFPIVTQVRCDGSRAKYKYDIWYINTDMVNPMGLIGEGSPKRPRG
jgi:hypothetical protein